MDSPFNMQYLIDNRLLEVCPLLPAQRFVKYCKKRGIQTSERQLERFEELGIFGPIARVRFPEDEDEHPHIRVKFREVDGGKTYHGEFEGGEEWDGEVEDLLISFTFEKDNAYRFLKAGLLWDPSSRTFEPWNSLKDRSKEVRSYYSIFQVYALSHLVTWTTMPVRAEYYIDYGEEEVERLTSHMGEMARSRISRFQEDGVKGEFEAAICQAISNRYFPFTQSDRRIMRVSGFGRNSDPDFYEYCRRWDAAAVLDDLGITTEDVKRSQEQLARDAKVDDPLEKWHGLVSFVSVDQRKRLKGSALYARSLYAMEHMLRLFYKDLTGVVLDPPDESPMWRPDTLYGDGVSANELEYLELLTNHYHLNPKPKLLLLVEGDGEYQQFPRLIDGLFGTTVARLGIKVQNLEGISNFTGQNRDRYGTLERFIDDHHSRQTFVYFVLDNEGRASDVRRKLAEARSRHAERRLTRPEYIHLWDKSIEFDNFTPEELARGMTTVSGNRYTFDAAEIAACEGRFGEVGDPLKRLYKEKLDYGLKKVELLEALVGIILSDPEGEFDEEGEAKRPLVKMLGEVVELASTNYQPVTRDIQQENQMSGYFGDPLS